MSVSRVAPEQANDRNVTDELGSAASSRFAAWAPPALSERWHRLSTQSARLIVVTKSFLTTGESGAPSPEADESPSTTTSRSLISTARVQVCSVPFLYRTVSVTKELPCLGNSSSPQQS